MQKILEEIRDTYLHQEGLKILQEDINALERVLDLDFIYNNIENSTLNSIRNLMIARQFELSQEEKKRDGY